MEWLPIESAPKDGTAFLALNHDREVWPATFTKDGRLAYRTNTRREPRKFQVHNIDGKRLLEEDEQFAKDGECWDSQWTLWQRLYEFHPTHWLPLPNPPSPPQSS